MSGMAARQSLISTWRWALDTFGEFLTRRPVFVRRLAVNAFVLMAGVLLMLARTSPALAADNSHGQGKSQDRTSASAVVQRTDSPGHKSDHQIGGSGDGDKNKAKGGSSSQPAPKAASVPAPASASASGSATVSSGAKAKSDTTASSSSNAKASSSSDVKASAGSDVKANVSGSVSAGVTAKGGGKASDSSKSGATVVTTGNHKEAGEGNSDSRGDVAGGKSGNGDDRTKSTHDHEVTGSTGSTASASSVSGST